MGYNLLQNMSVDNKKVILRVDWNVSFIKNGFDPYRIKATLPTIDYFLSKGARLIICTHWGRPVGYDYRFSTIHLVNFLKNIGYDAVFAAHISEVHLLIKSTAVPIIVLENLRFLPYEALGSSDYARLIASLGDCFVQEACGALGKKTMSTIELPLCFSSSQRAIGFLIQKELALLDSMRNTQSSENICIVGGAKVIEKFTSLLSALTITDIIILLPPLLGTWYGAFGIKRGTMAQNSDLYPLVIDLYRHAQINKKKIITPLDFHVKNAFGKYCFKDYDTVVNSDTIIGIGPQTIAMIQKLFKSCRYIFATGLSGFIDDPLSWYSIKQLFLGVSSSTTTIIAGGDSVLLAQKALVPCENRFYITGGSAAFSYLGRGSLPGLEVFKKEDKGLKG